MDEYEQEGYISVWLGTLIDAASLKEYLCETYDDDGDANCPFWSDLGVTWLDHDYQEAKSQTEPQTVDRFLEGFSYLESFRESVLPVAHRDGIVSVNAAIIVFDFAYPVERPFPHPSLRFIGSFPYSKRAG